MALLKKKQVALYLTDEQSKQVSLYADKAGVTRTKLMSDLISEGLNRRTDSKSEGVDELS